MQAGDTVTVINSTAGGQFFIEGHATLVKKMSAHRWTVKWANGETSERFIDEAAQGNASEYVARLNGRKSCS